MSLVRAHLPKNLMSMDALKCLAVSFLKYYIIKKRPHWDSTFGWLTDYVRNTTHAWTGLGTDENAEEIIDTCCALKTAIEDAKSYEDFIDIINTLIDKLVNPKKNQTERIPLYFVLINIMQQIIKVTPQFIPIYTAKVAECKKNIQEKEKACESTFNGSKHYKRHIEAIHANLYQLILILGDNTSFFIAHRYSYNPLPELLKPEPNAKDLAYLSETTHNDLWNIIESQLAREQSLLVSRDKMDQFCSPNINVHLYLQVDYLMYYCDKYLGVGLGKATLQAVEANKTDNGISFRKILNLPEKAVKSAAISEQQKVEAIDANANKYAKLDDVDKQSEEDKKPEGQSSEPVKSSQKAEVPQSIVAQTQESDSSQDNQANESFSPILPKKVEPDFADDRADESTSSNLDASLALSPTPDAEVSNNSPLPEAQKVAALSPGKPSGEGLFGGNNAGDGEKKLSNRERKKLKAQQAAAKKAEEEVAGNKVSNGY